MKEMLLEARNEILNLRRRNELLTAQVGVVEVFAVEVFAAVLGLRRNEGGAAPDVAWKLMKAYDDLDTAKGAE